MNHSYSTFLLYYSTIAGIILYRHVIVVQAYLLNPPEGHASLAKFAQGEIIGTLLNIGLHFVASPATDDDIDITTSGHGAHLIIQGLTVQLQDDNDGSDNVAVRNKIFLPGCNGFSPQISSGSKTINIEKCGTFVDMNGIQSMALGSSMNCWEMTWRENAEAGELILGLHLENSMKRNQLKIPSGNLYVQFPLWTKQGLEAYRELFHDNHANRQEQQDATYNSHDVVQELLWSQIPKPQDLILIDKDNDIFLNTKGTVSWKKTITTTSATSSSSSSFSLLQLLQQQPKGRQQILGTANVVRTSSSLRKE